MPLPKADDPNFPEALRDARTAKNLSYSKFAQELGIHAVMPSRYENRSHRDFCKPRLDTWMKMNQVLFGEGKLGVEKSKAQTFAEEMKKAIAEKKPKVPTEPVAEIKFLLPIIDLAGVKTLEEHSGLPFNKILVGLVRSGIEQTIYALDEEESMRLNDRQNEIFVEMTVDEEGNTKALPLATEDEV